MTIKIYLSIFLCGFAMSVFAQGVPPEAIKLKAIPYPCNWGDRPKSFQLKGDNAFSITADKGTDLYSFVDGTYYINAVPRLLFVPDGDFIFMAKVKGALNNVYDGGALIIYSDDGNWAKLLLERNDDKTIGLGSSIVRNRSTDDSYHITVDKDELYLKIARSGKVCCFYYSNDGKAWRLARTFAFDKTEGLRIGFYAQSPKGPECKLEFSNISYRATKFKDFFTGE